MTRRPDFDLDAIRAWTLRQAITNATYRDEQATPEERRRARKRASDHKRLRGEEGRTRDEGNSMTTPYYDSEGITVHHGDCLDVLRSLPDASVDSVVTDPPYGLEFMGKGWDGADGFRRSLNPADVGRDDPFGRASRTSPEYRADALFQEWCEAWSAECLRVLKPGGHLLAFGGTRTWHRLACAVEDAGFEIRDSIAWMYGSGFPKSLNLVDEHGERTGWGTALKPAHEPIVVARKPLTGTVAANVLAHGTGALNIDLCRVAGMSGPNYARDPKPDNSSGRWPANVVLDESQAEALDEQSGELTSGKMLPTHTDAARQVFGQNADGGYTTMETYGDSGGASRFFYVAKADASERVRVNGTAHPTVKPLTLMRWLVRLVTPPGGVVLEPFAGSGTTVEAALIEGFQCIAIERESEYLPLIRQRIDRRRDPVAATRTEHADDLGLFGLLDGETA